ncbi:MAG: hypothetical protein V9F06_03240 [Thermomicrobiales bacterium]
MSATRWSSCEVGRRDDDAHAARAEHALDAVLAGEDLALTHGGAHRDLPKTRPTETGGRKRWARGRSLGTTSHVIEAKGS